MKNETGELWHEIARLRGEIDILRGSTMQTDRCWQGGRMLILASGLVIGLAVGWFFIDTTAVSAQNANKFQVLTCKGLKIVRPNGKEMVVLGFDDDGGLIQLMTKNQKLSTMLSVDKDGDAWMRLNGGNGKSALFLGKDADGGYIRAYTKDGKDVAFFGVNQKSTGGLINLFDRQGKIRLILEGSDEGGFVEKH